MLRARSFPDGTASCYYALLLQTVATAPNVPALQVACCVLLPPLSTSTTNRLIKLMYIQSRVIVPIWQKVQRLLTHRR